MFVKPGTSFQKLLDKKPLRITVYGDSKGLKHFRKFTITLYLPHLFSAPELPGKILPATRLRMSYFPEDSRSLKIISLE